MDELRKNAEIKLNALNPAPIVIETMSPEQIKETIHELNIHQIELEMQIDELRLTQEQLIITRSRYFELYDFAPVGYCTLDHSGKISKVNITAMNMLGILKNDLLNQSIHQFIYKDDQDIYYLFCKNLTLTSELQSCEVRMLKKDGTLFWVQLTATPIQSLNQIRVDRLIISNIDKIKHTEKQLLHSAQFASLGVIAMDIAHQITNPLKMISDSVGSLSAQIETDDSKRKFQAIDRALSKIARIITGLKKFSQDSNQRSQNRYSMAKIIKKVSLAKIVNEAILTTAIKSTRDKVFVTSTLDEEVSITCDEFEIEQVIINLITNAIDAAKSLEEKWVKVEVLARHEFAILKVTDSGSGVPAELLSQIFTPFFSTKSETEGLGLGLSITKEILNDHNATIAVVPDSLNTCFEVVFLKT